MKILSKLIKLVFTFVFFLLLLITLPIVLMYKSSTPPEIQDGGVFNVSESLKEQIDNLIDPSVMDKEIAFYIEEDYVNNQIYQALVTSMNDRLSSESGYLIELTPNILIQGVWVSFSNEVMSINLSVNFRVLDITYKTQLHISLKVSQINAEHLVLKIDKLKVGNFSLKWLIRVAPEIAKHISGFDLDSFIEQAFLGYGSYNNKKQEVNINISSLFDQMFDESELIDSIGGLFGNKNFFYMGSITKEKKNYFKIGFNLNAMYDQTNEFKDVLPEYEEFKSEEEIKVFMTEVVFLGALRQTIDLSEKDITNLLNYSIKKTGNQDDEFIAAVPLFEDYHMDVYTPYFRIKEEATLNVPIRFGKGDNYFKTILKINLRFTKRSNDLILGFKNFTFGSLLVDNKLVDLLFSKLNLENFEYKDNSLAFKDFFKIFSTDDGEDDKRQDIDVMNIRVEDEKLRIKLVPIDTSGMLEDIITGLPNEEFVNIIEDIYDKLMNNGNLNSDDLDDLLKEFQDLSDEERDLIFDFIKDRVQGS